MSTTSRIGEIINKAKIQEEKEALLAKYGSKEDALALLNSQYADIVERFNAAEQKISDYLTQLRPLISDEMSEKLEFGIALLKEYHSKLTPREREDFEAYGYPLIHAKINFYNESCIPVCRIFEQKMLEMEPYDKKRYAIDRERIDFYRTVVEDVKKLFKYEQSSKIFEENAEKIKLSDSLSQSFSRIYRPLIQYDSLAHDMKIFAESVKHTRFAPFIKENTPLSETDAHQKAKNDSPTIDNPTTNKESTF